MTAMGRDGGTDPARQDFFISYAVEDRAWAEWIGWQLESAGYKVLIQAWDFSAGARHGSWINEGIDRAESVIVVLSSAYARSVFGEAEWQAAWTASSARPGTRRIIPVKVDHSASPPGLLATLIYLDLTGVDEDAARERLLSGVEGKEKPRAAPGFPDSRQSLPGRRKPTSEPEFPLDSPRQQASEFEAIPLEDVFQPAGVPKLTFVAPSEYIPFRLALRQRGLCVVLEGPSGIGKTTLLDWAVSQDLARLGAVTTYTARRVSDIELISRLPDVGHTGIVAIDDFHRLSQELQHRLVDYLKRIADDPNPSGKLVIVGIPETAASLVTASFDVASRLRVFSLGPATREQITELISKGEAALNIAFSSRHQIIEASAGSLITAQSLCAHLAALAGIEGTMLEPTVVQTDVHEARAQVTKQLKINFWTAVNEFAAMDGPDEVKCVDLLLELARTNDGIVALDESRLQSPSLMAALEKISPESSERVRAAETPLTRHFFYDSRGKRIIADDPQLLFYLRHLDRATLLSAAGKRLPIPRSHAFVCYSHADTRWLERLLVHLDPVARAGVLDVWSDKKIEIGDDWDWEISKALGRARFAVLLVSADFLASDYIRRVELPTLLAAAAGDGCRIVPILVRASTFNETPELSRFQHANPGSRTLASLSEEEAEQVLAKVAKWILSLIKKDAE